MKPKAIVLALVVLALVAGGIFVAQEKQEEKMPSAPLASSSDEVPYENWEPPADWKTYRNDVFGFEVKYPPHYKVRINNPPTKNNPAFIDEKYEGTLESPALSIDFDPLFTEIEHSWYQAQAPRFKKEYMLPRTGAIPIILTDVSGNVIINKEGKKLYAMCSIYILTDAQYHEDIIGLCNQIISTLKITK